MRVALVPSAYAPAVGGVELLTARLASQLRTAGVAVEVWTIRHPPGLPADELLDGLRVRRFSMPMPRLDVAALVRLPVAARRAFQALCAASDELRPDIIHVQCYSANGAYAARLAARRDIPLVVTLQGETVMDDADIYEHSLTLRASLRRSLRGAAAVTACSAFVLTDAERRFSLQPGRGSVIPNGVDLEPTVERAAADLPFTRFVLGVGRVVEKKGFDLLLAAYERVRARHPDLGLVIGGDGPAREALMSRCRDRGLEAFVAFPGVLSPAQVAWLMDAAAVFVLPSRLEPFGIVVLEALRAGCPTIVSSHGGATEIVQDGVSGLVADPFNADALANAIERLLTDDALAAALARGGSAAVRRYQWELIADRYRETYDRVRRTGEAGRRR